MNKKLTSVLSGVLLGITGIMNAQTWSFATAQGTGYYNACNVQDMDDRSLTTSFVVGDFSGTNLVLGSTTLTNNFQNVYTDAFLCKISSTGAVSWAVQASGADNESFKKVLSYETGSGPGAIVYGTYAGSSVTFYSTNSATLSLSGGHGFLVNYNSSGVVQWAIPFSGSLTDFGVPATGDLFFAISGNNLTEAVAVKGYSLSTGSTAGFSLTSNTTGSYGKGITVDASNNVYLLVEAHSNFHITGSPTLGVTTDQSIILKYNSSGTYQWAKQLAHAGTANIHGTDINVDNSGVYISGSYQYGAAYMDYPNISTFVLPSPSGSGIDGYVGKYDLSTGSAIWVNRIAGAGDDIPVQMSYGGGKLFVAVNNVPSNSVTFVGQCATSTYSSTTSGTDNKWYTLAYDPSGPVLWSAAPTLSGTNELPVGIKGGSNYAIVGGQLTGQINFGSNSVTHTGTYGSQPSLYYAKATQIVCLTGQVTGVEEQGETDRNVYPNPTTGVLNFTLKPEDRNVSIVITDQLGRTVLTADHLESKDGQLNLELLPAGMYFYNVKTENGAYQGRIIRE